ncbi:MAG TPA: arylsulfatase [Candidatus Binataceae bacterium]|nr:arylsulfatase [Candidatus Binataceae bacterium]
MKASGYRAKFQLAVALAVLLLALPAARAAMQVVRSYSSNQFNGVIGFTYKQSQPAWPALPKAKPGSPNVVIFLLDDVGFANLGSYGGPIRTPNIDRLAQAGLRYNNYTTTALCSPTRAALLTGRNHHWVGFGTIIEAATGYPGYNGLLPDDAGTIATILKLNGYATFAIGKWHNTPIEFTSPLGPFKYWPTGIWGFEHFYGFQGGEASQWNPELFEGTVPILRDNTLAPMQEWDRRQDHLTALLADKAIESIRQSKAVNPDRPFFLYFAPAACHAPHQAPKEFIDHYKGRFDKGWDQIRQEILTRQKEMGVVPSNTELAPRAPGVKPWADLAPAEQRLFAREMEVYAGYLEHADYEFGRILGALQQSGQMDNTLIIVSSDNGASAEGGPVGTSNEFRTFNRVPEPLARDVARIGEFGSPLTYNHYPVGWAQASNTPLKYYKQTVHYGGVRDPLIIYYPKVIKDKGAIRRQFCHVIDVMPTILDVLGIKPPAVINGVAQRPIQGVSFAATFTGANAPPARHVQYYEMVGNRGIWRDGWKAVVYHARMPWDSAGSLPFERDKWELYHIDDDFAEIHDLSARYPDKIKELQTLWLEEAKKNNVLPLDDRLGRIAGAKPWLPAPRATYIYTAATYRVPEMLAPDIKNRSYSITAEVEIPAGGGDGMLVTNGGRFGGYAFFVQNGRPTFVYNDLGDQRFIIASSEAVPAGKASLRFEFTKTGDNSGAGALFINGKKTGEGKIDRTVPFVFSDHDTFDVGRDTGTPVAETYRCPFRFTGVLDKVVFELKNDKGQAAMKKQAQGAAEVFAGAQ